MTRLLFGLAAAAFLLAVIALAYPPVADALGGKRYQDGIVWSEPKVITPGETSTAPPSDAIILFNGKNFDAWKGAEKWKIDEDGGTTAVSRIETKQAFGDIQLHVEWASPNPPKGKDQGRGNNGIGLMGAKYEIQVLDSFNNPTYFVGQAASVYNQTPPLVNAMRKPGEWNTYDIIFEAPRFDKPTKEGKLLKPGIVTVLHNGVLVQNHTEIKGSTHYDQPYAYTPHADKLPLVLMYHGDPVRFRNIWVREIVPLEKKEPEKK
jgi:hypothetical protein